MCDYKKQTQSYCVITLLHNSDICEQSVCWVFSDTTGRLKTKNKTRVKEHSNENY